MGPQSNPNDRIPARLKRRSEDKKGERDEISHAEPFVDSGTGYPDIPDESLIKSVRSS
jgi:hypothetical protein